MAISRGKDFEKIVQKTFNDIPEVLCERLHDQMTGYVNVSRNPSDFIVYKYPNMYYVECKTIHGASIPIINFKQHDLIKERCVVEGVKGIYIVWFVDKKITFWIDYEIVENAIKQGVKSLNYSTLMTMAGVKIVPAVYKVVYGKYDFSKMFEV